MKVNSLVKISLFSALTAILSQISIPIGPVPISLGTFGVYLSAVFLSPKDAFVSQLLYLTLGIIGIPVFSGFGSGIGHLLGFTGGFAISYPFVAFICSLGVKKYKESNNIFILLLSFVLGTIICYLLGVLWFCAITKMNIVSALYLVVFPFVISDMVKVVISIVITNKIKKY